VVCVWLSGCAARQAGPTFPNSGTAGDARLPGEQGTPAADSLDAFIGKVRRLAANARPVQVQGETIEQRDPRLAAALLAATTMQTPEAYRAAAREYRRLGVFDKAHEYLNRALALGRRDGATYDALARIWRDSGFPHLALGDAYRAVFYAPDSAIVRNTLGTVFQAIGLQQEARQQYETALGLDPTAAYALNNLCYGLILDGAAVAAVKACQRALETDPTFAVARNNLAIAYAATGDTVRAREAFAQAGDEASMLYNVGIVHLARREYRAAADAFQAAQRVRPSRQVATRIRQAIALSEAGGAE
jgi:Flp pilus assembly protein TadD